jgi:uncharacterized protein YjeT (DUF2065 family)
LRAKTPSPRDRPLVSRLYLIAFFGLVLIILSAVMVSCPACWARGIVRFSETAYFHSFEIVSRLAFGAIFITYAPQTAYPPLMQAIGYILTTVGLGLLLTPPSRHKQFAVWSADKFETLFRPAGIISMGFGVFIVFAAISGPESW